MAVARPAASKKRSSSTLAGEAPASCVLVQWVEDYSVGVMPMKSVKDKPSVEVGKIVDIYWKGKTSYPAETLKISSEHILQ